MGLPAKVLQHIRLFTFLVLDAGRLLPFAGSICSQARSEARLRLWAFSLLGVSGAGEVHEDGAQVPLYADRRCVGARHVRCATAAAGGRAGGGCFTLPEALWKYIGLCSLHRHVPQHLPSRWDKRRAGAGGTTNDVGASNLGVRRR